MLNLVQPNTALLDDPANRERHPLDYSILALHWLYWAKATGNAHVAAIDQHFLDAMEAVIRYFDSADSMTAHDAAAAVRQELAYWRRDFDPNIHPLSQLGRVMRGNPGNHLEYKGPVFLLTFHEILEGITTEEVVEEWDIANDATAEMLLGIATIVLAEIALAVYWSLKANGHHLNTELGRLFGPANRAALIGQLGNLVLAGQVASWGLQLNFIPEAAVPTPEWSITSGPTTAYVECTTYQRLLDAMNNEVKINEAIKTAWNAKHGKFSAQYAPGIISTDISGVFVSREFGTLLLSDHCRRVDAPLPDNTTRTIGVYDLRSDWELLQQESMNRQMLGVVASALHSADAKIAGIQGFLAYQGQQLSVDLVSNAIRIPKRAFLVWRGGLDDSNILRIVISLSQPAIPRPVSLGTQPPMNIFLV